MIIMVGGDVQESLMGANTITELLHRSKNQEHSPWTNKACKERPMGECAEGGNICRWVSLNPVGPVIGLKSSQLEKTTENWICVPLPPASSSAPGNSCGLRLHGAHETEDDKRDGGGREVEQRSEGQPPCQSGLFWRRVGAGMLSDKCKVRAADNLKEQLRFLFNIQVGKNKLTNKHLSLKKSNFYKPQNM